MKAWKRDVWLCVCLLLSHKWLVLGEIGAICYTKQSGVLSLRSCYRYPLNNTWYTGTWYTGTFCHILVCHTQFVGVNVYGVKPLFRSWKIKTTAKLNHTNHFVFKEWPMEGYEVALSLLVWLYILQFDFISCNVTMWFCDCNFVFHNVTLYFALATLLLMIATFNFTMWLYILRFQLYFL